MKTLPILSTICLNSQNTDAKLSRLSFIFVLALLVPCSVYADITGKITDENNVPIDYVQVVGLRADSTVVGSAYTDEEGFFKLPFSDVTILNVTALGYKSRFIPANNGEMGNIRLEKSSISLAEIVVKGTPPVSRMEGNALVTPISGTYLSELGTADEVLGWLPTVSGTDGEFKVFGRGKPLIYLDGRKITDTGELKRLPAEDIRDIKVISSPGSQYDASIGAVIRIRTKKKSDEGFGLFTSSNVSYGHFLAAREQLNTYYRNKGLDVGVSVYGRHEKRKYENVNESHTYLRETVSEYSQMDAFNKYSHLYGKLQLNYAINENHSVGGYYENAWTDENIRTKNNTTMMLGGTYYDSWKTRGKTHSPFYQGHDLNLYYNGKIKNMDVDFNMDYTSSSPVTDSTIDEAGEVSGDQTVVTKSVYDRSLLAEKLIVGYDFSNSRIELGEEHTRSNIDMDYKCVEGPLSDNDTRVRERNTAVFGNYIQRIGNFSIEAGVRYEHVNYQYTVKGMLRDDMSRKYNRFFPSLSLSAQFGELSLSLSYSNKTQRPRYKELDETLVYHSRISYGQGNPELKEVKKEAIELMATLKPVFLQLSLQRNKNSIMFVSRPYNEEGTITLTTYENASPLKEIDIMVGTHLEFGAWDTQLSAGVTKQWFRTEFLGAMKSMNKPMGNFKWENSLVLPWGTRLTLDYSLETGGDITNAFYYPQSALNIGIFHKFCNGKFDVRLTGTDLLNRDCTRDKRYTGLLYGTSLNYYDSRRVSLTFRYRLNVPKSKYKGTGAGASEKARM